MSNLYGPKLSRVFDKIYQGFIDYNAEYLFYAELCQEKNIKSILELGCGTGNLAAYLSKHFEDYLGLDYSQHMLSIAREKFPNGNFVQRDMRNFSLNKTYDAALITGRSTSYLLASDDLLSTFKCIHKVLNPNGYLIFDCIDATKFIPYIRENPTVLHTSKVENTDYYRTSDWYSIEKDPTLIHWTASYYKEGSSENLLLGKDKVIFKVFTEMEINSALNKAGFVVEDKLDRPSYAFDTFVIVAKKSK